VRTVDKVFGEAFQSLVGAMRTVRIRRRARAPHVVSIPRRGNEDTASVYLRHSVAGMFQSLVGAMRTALIKRVG